MCKKNIINTKKVHIVCEDDDLSDFINTAAKTKYTYYPIVNKEKKCLGIIKFADVGYHNKKKVILVDHNSYEQSVIGLNEADYDFYLDLRKYGSARHAGFGL